MKDAKHRSDVGSNDKEQSMNRITQKKVHVWEGPDVTGNSNQAIEMIKFQEGKRIRPVIGIDRTTETDRRTRLTSGVPNRFKGS